MGVFKALKRLFGGITPDFGEGAPGPDAIENFLFFEKWLPVESSNVAAAHYVMRDHKLTVEFHNGSFYEVTPISLEEASSFANAPSKGKWYWDNVRVRGTKDGEKKNVVKLTGVSK